MGGPQRRRGGLGAASGRALLSARTAARSLPRTSQGRPAVPQATEKTRTRQGALRPGAEQQLRAEASSLPAGPARERARHPSPVGCRGPGWTAAALARGGTAPRRRAGGQCGRTPDDARQAVNVVGRNRLRKLRVAEEERVLTGAHTCVMPLS